MFSKSKHVFFMHLKCACSTRLSVGGKKIPALYREFMRQALGSSAVQSAALITSDVSHCLGLTSSEESRKRLAALSGFGPQHGLGALGLFIREKRCIDCPVVHRCKKHEPKPSQNIDSTASVSEYTQSQSELALLSGLISCVHPSYFRAKTFHTTSFLCYETIQSQVESRNL